jgi:chemotaxis protein methyltransferase CheR
MPAREERAAVQIHPRRHNREWQGNVLLSFWTLNRYPVVIVRWKTVHPASHVTEKPSGFEFPFTQADFHTIVSIVYERSGIVLAASKRDMAYARLVQRLRALGLSSFRDYCQLLSSNKGADEIGFLINAITTNLTKFFRESHHFEHLRHHVLPELAKAAGAAIPRIRVWSAGCSSGEEPYSIAMTALAARTETGRDWDFNILATDLDTTILEHAKAGIYPKASLETVPAAMRERFFDTHTHAKAGNVRISPQVQSLITFKPLNLTKPWHSGMSFDVIFCRNVTIYFDAKTKASIINRFHSILKNGGWLYVGHSESLHEHQHQFKPSGRTIYQKINS